MVKARLNKRKLTYHEQNTGKREKNMSSHLSTKDYYIIRLWMSVRRGTYPYFDSLAGGKQ